jgi:hypothetical protein
MVDTNTHAPLWSASGFQPEGPVGGVAVGMTGSGPFTDYGTLQGRNAQSGTPVWSVPSVQSATKGTPDDQTAVVSPEVAVFYGGALTNQTYLVSIADGRILKTLSDQYSCEYDQVSVIACYAPGVDNAVLIGFDATSLAQLWQLHDAAGTRIAPVLHAAYKRLLYTEANNGNVILDARTGADLVTDVSIAPDLGGVLARGRSVGVHAVDAIERGPAFLVISRH